MSRIRKLFKKAAQFITASEINTCYYAPQARKNRIPAYFEQLEPRQLLSGTQVDTDDTVADQVVLAETFEVNQAGPEAALAGLEELLKQAANPPGPDFSGLLQSAGLDLPSFQGLDWDNFDFFSLGDDLRRFEFRDSSINGANLGDRNVWFSNNLNEILTITGDFTGNAANKSMLIVASGAVDLQNVTFGEGLDSIIIRASAVTFGNLDTFGNVNTLTIQGGQLIISALDYVEFSGGKIKGSGGLDIYAVNKIVAEGVNIDVSGDVSLNSVAITVDHQADISATNLTVSANSVSVYMALLGIREVSGEFSAGVIGSSTYSRDIHESEVSKEFAGGLFGSVSAKAVFENGAFNAKNIVTASAVIQIKGSTLMARENLTVGANNLTVTLAVLGKGEFSGEFADGVLNQISAQAGIVNGVYIAQNNVIASAEILITEEATLTAGNNLTVSADNQAVTLAVLGNGELSGEFDMGFIGPISVEAGIKNGVFEAQNNVTASAEIHIVNSKLLATNGGLAVAANNKAVTLAVIGDGEISGEGAVSVLGPIRGKAVIESAVFNAQNYVTALATIEVTDSSRLEAGGGLSVAANNETVSLADIQSWGISGELGLNLLGPIRADVNLIKNSTVDAVNRVTSEAVTLIDGSYLKAGGLLGVDAANRARAEAVAVKASGEGDWTLAEILSASIGLETRGIGVTNTIDSNKAETRVSDSALVAGGDLNVTSNNEAVVQAVLVNGDLSGKASLFEGGLIIEAGAELSGVFATNSVTSLANTYIANSTLTAGGGLNVTAKNKAAIKAYTVSAKLAAGPSADHGHSFDLNGVLAWNKVTGGASAIVAGGALDSRKNLAVTAGNLADILAVALNGSLGVPSVGLLAGVNKINMDTFALVQGGREKSVLSAGGDLSVTAWDKSKIWTVAVAAAADKEYTMALANTTSVITGAVWAGIHGADTVAAAGDLRVKALSSAQIGNIAIGAAFGQGSGLAVQATTSENIILREVRADLAHINQVTVGGGLVVRAFEAVPEAVGDWRQLSYLAGAGIGEVGGIYDYDFNKNLFRPENGIFSLVVSVAAPGTSAAIPPAVNFNWLQRSVTAVVDYVSVLKFTGAAPQTNGLGSLTVEALSYSGAFGGVLSVGAGGSLALGLAAAVNVLANETQAELKNSAIGGWAGPDWAPAKLGAVTVRAINTAGATALAVGVGGGALSGGASTAMNLGLLGLSGKKLAGAAVTVGQARALSREYSENIGFQNTTLMLEHLGDTGSGSGFTAKASIEAASIKAGGGVAVKADNQAAYVAALLLIAGGKAGSGAGGFAFNLADSLSEANLNISGEGVNTNGAVTVKAENSTRMWAVIAAVAGATGAAGAGTLALNKAEIVSQAHLAGGSGPGLTAGSVTVDSKTNADLYAVALAVAAAQGVVGAASFAVNAVATPTEAVISGAADNNRLVMNVEDGVTVRTDNASQIVAAAGGVAVSGSGLSGGLSGAVNVSSKSGARLREIAQTHRETEAQPRSEAGLAYPDDLGEEYAFTYDAPAYVSYDQDEVLSSSARFENVNLTARGLTVQADSKRQSVTVAAGASVAKMGSGYGSVAVSVSSNRTRALVQNSTLAMKAGNVSVMADNVSDSHTLALAIAIAGQLAGGAGVAVNVDTGETEARLNGVVIANVKDVNVKASTTLNAFTLTVAATGAGAAGALTVARTELRGSTRAYILDSTIINASGTVSALANWVKPSENFDLTKLKAAEGKGGGLGGLLDKAQGTLDEAKNDVNQGREEGRYEEDVQKNGDAFKNSLSSSGLLTIAVSLAGGGAAGAVAISVNKISGDVAVKVERSEIAARAGEFNATMMTAVQSYVTAAGGGGNVLAGSIGVNTISGQVTSYLNSTKLTLNGGAGQVTATQDLSIIGLAGGLAGAGGVAGGFGLVVNTITGASLVGAGVADNSAITVNEKQKFEVNATRSGAIRSYAIGVAVGLGAGAFGGGVAVNTLNGGTKAVIDGGLFNSGGQLNVLAKETITSTTLGVQAAISLEGAAAVGWAVTTASGQVQASLKNADLTGQSLVKVEAQSSSVLTIKGIGAAGGFLAAGLVKSDIKLKNKVTAEIADSTFHDVAKVQVTGQGDWNLYAYSLAGAGGIVSGSGARAGAHLNSTTVDAHISGVSLYNVGAVSIAATGTPKILAVAAAPSLALAASVGVAWAEADISPTLLAYAEKLNVYTTPTDLSVKAELITPSGYSAEARGYALAAGLLGGVGGTEARVNNNSVVRAYVDAINADGAFNSLTVLANDNAALRAYATGLGYGGVAGVGVAVSQINSATRTEAYIATGQATANTVLGNLKVQASSSVLTDQETQAGAGAIGLAGAAAVARQDLTAATKSGLGVKYREGDGVAVTDQALFNVGGALDLRAESEFKTNQSLKAKAKALLGGAGGDGKININADTKAEVGDRAKLSAREINILSLNDLKRGIPGYENGADSTAAGAITVQAGLTETKITANSDVVIGEGAILTATGAANIGLALQAFNLMNVEDSLAFSSASLVGAPFVSGAVTAILNANILIGDKANLETNNSLGSDIIIHAGSYERVDLEVGAYIWGAVSAGSLKAHINVTTNNAITVKKEAYICSSRDLALAAGYIGYKFVTAENGGIGNSFLYLSGEIRDKTAFPASRVTDSGIQWEQANFITVDTGANLASRGDADLNARQATVSINSQAIAYNWVNNLFDPMDSSVKETTVSNIVTMNGHLTAGVKNTIEAKLYQLTKANWEENIDKLDPAERERIETAMHLFELLFGPKYFDYNPVTYANNRYNGYLNVAKEFAPSEWLAFLNSLDNTGKSILDRFVTPLMRDVFVTLCQSDMDTLKGLGQEVEAYQQEIAGLLDKLDLVNAEKLYQRLYGSPASFWQSFLDREASPASVKLTNDQRAAINLIIGLCDGSYEEAEKLLAAYAHFINEETALNAAFVSKDGWETFIDEFKGNIPGYSPTDWEVFGDLALHDAKGVEKTAWDACRDKFRKISEYKYISGQLIPIYETTWSDDREAAFNALKNGDYVFASLTNTTQRNILLALINEYAASASQTLEDTGYAFDTLPGGCQSILRTVVEEKVKAASQALVDKSYDFASLDNKDHQSILQAAVNQYVKAHFAGYTDNGHQAWLDFYNCPSMVHGEWSLADAIMAANQGLDNAALGALNSLKCGDASIFNIAFWNTLKANGQELIGGNLNSNQRVLLDLLVHCNGRLADIALFGQTAFNAYARTFVEQRLTTDPTNSLEAKALTYELGYMAVGQNSSLLSYEMGVQTLGRDLLQQYKDLRYMISVYGQQDPATEVLLIQMGNMEDDLIGLGYGERVGGQFRLKDDNSASMLTIKKALINKGNVNIYADTLKGSGEIAIEGDASLWVENNIAGAALYVSDITISSKAGGRINLHESKLEGALKLTETDYSNTSMTVIQNIRNSLLLVGDLYNLSGVTTLRSEGNLSIIDSVFAAKQNVFAVGTLTVSLKKDGSFYNAGGLPVTVSGDYKSGYTITGNRGGYMLALGDINLKASYINANGLIQSGVKSYYIKIESWEKAGGALWLHDNGTVSNKNVSSTDVWLRSYDFVADTYILESIYAGGGSINITGYLLNTNTDMGEIAIYNNPDITIINDSAYNLVVKSLNTGTTEPGGIWQRDTPGQILDPLKVVYDESNRNYYYHPTNHDIKYHFKVGETEEITKTYTKTENYLWNRIHWSLLFPDTNSMTKVGELNHDLGPLGETGGFFTTNPTYDPYALLTAPGAADEYHLYGRAGTWRLIDNPGVFTGWEFVPATPLTLWPPLFPQNNQPLVKEGPISQLYPPANVTGQYVQYTVQLKHNENNLPIVTVQHDRFTPWYNVDRIYTKKVTDTVQHVTWFIVETDKRIKVTQQAAGGSLQGGGNIIISSVGSVRLDGGLTAGGAITIITQGNLTDANESWINSAIGQVTVTAANGSIGTAGNRVKILASKALLNLTAGRTIFAQVSGGDVNVAAKADQLIDLSVSHVLYGTLLAPKLVLAAGGGLGSADDRLVLGNDAKAAASVTVNAAVTGDQGGMYLTSKITNDTSETMDLRLGQLTAPGTIDLKTDYSIYDANDQDSIDQRDLNRWQAMWDRLGILIDDRPGGHEKQVQTKVEEQCNQLTGAYHGYNELLNAMSQAGGREAYLDARVADETFKTLEDAAIWLETALRGYEKQLDEFDPTLRPGPYDQNLKITVADLSNEHLKTLQERANGSLFTKEVLASKLSEALFNGSTSTLFTETANIVAENIKLDAKAIGTNKGRNFIITDYNKKDDKDNEDYSFTSDDVFFRDLLILLETGQVKGEFIPRAIDPVTGTLTFIVKKYVVADYDKKMDGRVEFADYEFSAYDKFFIWTSEVTARHYDEAKDTLTVDLIDDLNVQLTGGQLNLYAKDYAYIGTGVKNQSFEGSQDLTIGTAIVYNGELWIKADGSLFTTSDGQGLNAGYNKEKGDYLVVEASNGGLGQEGNYLKIGKHELLRLRAFGDMYVYGLVDEKNRVNGDLKIDAIGKEAGSEAKIRGYKNIYIKNDRVIVPEKTHLTAGWDDAKNAYGGGDWDVYLEGQGRDSNIETRKDSVVTGRDVIVNGKTVSLDGKVEAANDLDLTGSRDIAILGQADLHAENEVRLTATNAIEARKDSVITGRDVIVNGETLSLDGKVEAANDLDLTGSRDITILGQADLHAENEVRLTAATIKTMANSALEAGRDVIIGGVTIRLEGAVTARKGNIDLAADRLEDLSLLGRADLKAGTDILLKATVIEAQGGAAVAAGRDIAVEGRQVRWAGKASAGENINISGAEIINLAGQAGLNAGRHLTLSGPRVNLLGQASLAYGDLNITLADFAGQGRGGNRLVIDDGVTFTQNIPNGRALGGLPEVNVAGLGDDDTIDLRSSSLDSAWQLYGENSGDLRRSGLHLFFAGVENILAGSGKDDLYLLPGGAIRYLDLGGGYNTAFNRTKAPMTFEMNGNNRLIVSNRSRVIIPTLLNAREIVGSPQGDTLVYRDSSRSAAWVVNQDNQGALNGLAFSHITTSIHDAPGGTFDLYMRMDNIEIIGTPFTVNIHPGGSYSYFHDIDLNRAVTVRDLRGRNNVVEKGFLNLDELAPRNRQYLASAGFQTRLEFLLKPDYDKDYLFPDAGEALADQAFTTKSAELTEPANEPLAASGSTEVETELEADQAPPEEAAPIEAGAKVAEETGGAEEAENLKGPVSGEAAVPPDKGGLNEAADTAGEAAAPPEE